ncbi:transposase [Nocardia sp. NEAU-G5]|uniref:Transposase n=1 Tax=Nocardia albiluteola TaxID=2842303 RepID=A0ABS6B8Z0_9NOCA|nr:transposase [Nocardia albiluteola]
MTRSSPVLLGAFRPCFTTPTFTTFVTLTIGMIAAPTRRTVCGMLTAARMSGHHARARRTLIAARYCADLPGDPTPEQIHTIRLAWANAAA